MASARALFNSGLSEVSRRIRSTINCEPETLTAGFQRAVGELPPVVDQEISSEEGLPNVTSIIYEYSVFIHL
jgi:hypothetical protein